MCVGFGVESAGLSMLEASGTRLVRIWGVFSWTEPYVQGYVYISISGAR